MSKKCTREDFVFTHESPVLPHRTSPKCPKLKKIRKEKCETFFKRGIITPTISSCNGLVDFTSDVHIPTLTVDNLITTNPTFNFCTTPLEVTTINPCSTGAITINGNVDIPTLTTSMLNLTGTLQLCTGGLVVSTVSPCPGTTSVTFTSDIVVAGALAPFSGELFSFAPVSPTTITSTDVGTTNVNSQTVNTDVLNATTINAGSITSTGPITVDTIIPSSGTLTINGDLDVCAGQITTSTISDCGSGLTIASPTVFNDTVSICTQPLTVGTITACGPSITVTSDTTFNGNVTISGALITCPGAISTSGITDCGAGLLINSTNSIFSGNVNICAGSLNVGLINDCGAGLTVNANIVINGALNLCASPLTVASITDCGAGLNVTSSNVVFSNNVRICTGALSVATINNCGAGLTINTPTTFTQNVNMCAATLSLATIGSCGAGLTINPITTFVQDVNICGGVLSVATINGCGAGLLINANVTFMGTVNICGATLSVSSISPCVGFTRVFINGDLDVCSGSVFTGTIASCGAGLTINSANVTFSQNVGICGGTLTVATVADCGAGITVTSSNVMFSGNVGVCTGIFSTGTIQGCGSGLNINAAPVTFSGVVNICVGPLNVNNINPCIGNTTVTFGGNVSVLSGNIVTNNINPTTQLTIGGTGILNTGSIFASNYDLTTASVGTTTFSLLDFAPTIGGDIVGPLSGPGGNVRNFNTIVGTNPNASGVVVTTDTTTNNVIVDAANLKWYFGMGFTVGTGQVIPTNTWTQLLPTLFEGNAFTGPNGVAPLVSNNGSGGILRMNIGGTNGFVNNYIAELTSQARWFTSGAGGSRYFLIKIGTEARFTVFTDADLVLAATTPGIAVASQIGPAIKTAYNPGMVIELWVYQNSGVNQTIGNDLTNRLYLRGHLMSASL
jgi:hypothetical protein